MLRQVMTENGPVRGLPAADPRITAFKGVPFAAPPVGALRWRAPQPAENWEGVRECYAFAPISMQETPGENPQAFYSKEWHVDPEIPMDEDCLYLNIWTPAKSAGEKLPVMVWIFGGGFQCGYPAEMEFDGERLARRGVILVSVNYRVNVFGFLAHPELAAEAHGEPVGNYGLQDQTAGIQWVRRNIAAFGGDPENITIFGQSAGGGSVLSQMTSPLTDGLFQKAIMQSGGGLRAYSTGPFRPLEEAFDYGKKFLETLGVSSIQEARKVDARTLLEKGLAFNAVARWQPTVDGVFLPEDPTQLILQGKHHDIPYMAGNTGADLLGTRPPKTLEEFRELMAPELGDKVDEFIELCGLTDASQLEELYRTVGFNRREFGNKLWCRAQLSQGRRPLYLYRFDPEIPGDDAGSFHSSDLWFVFETLAKCWRPFVGKHYDLARQMCNYWTNFARSGDPNGLDADGTPMPQWTPYTEDRPYAMEFGDKCAMGEHPEDPVLKFRLDTVWEKIKK